MSPGPAASVFELIGNTPMVELRHVTRDLAPGVRVLAKAEWTNPGGSVKDRAARQILLEAERSGALRPGQTILDSTSGNTGIALAMLGAARGYPVALVMPKNVSEERKMLIDAFGASIVYTDPIDGSDGALLEARRRVEAEPSRWFYADQYNNPANPRAHQLTTGPEIWEQTGGEITHFVVGLGTSGTFVGVTRALKGLSPRVVCVSMEPATPVHGLEGLKHMETAIRPGIYDDRLADRRITVETEEAYEMARRLPSEEGILVGYSGAANVCAALAIAREMTSGLVVTVFPDHGTRYLSGWLAGK
ncbi:MAG: cysteine synthase family protein [Planctomycetes bacterium]|nr:cysteine synthase family protein [Planctomycetota bacterium]